MAKITQVFELKTETGDATRDIKKLDQDMTHLAETIGVEVSGSISAMEDKLYELAIQGQQNTEEFKKLQEQTARYKQIVIETDRSIDALAEQGRGLSNALAIAEGTVAGYQAFAGVSALLGSENEELLETMTKLQAAQGVLNSIMVIRQQLQEKSIALSRLQAAAQGAYNFVVGTSTGLLKLLRIAMASTGIGLLVAGVGVLIANFDKLIGFFQPVINGFKAIGDWIGLTSFAESEAAEKSAEIHREKMQQIEQEANARARAHEARINQLNRDIALLEAQGKSTFEVRKEVINLELAQIRQSETARKELEKQLESLAKMPGQYQVWGEALEKFQQESFDLTEKAKDLENDLLLLEENNNKKRAADAKQYRDKRIAKEKKFKDELFKLEQQQTARMNALLDEIAKVEEDYLTSERDKAVNAVTDKYFRLIEEAKQYGQDVSVLEQAQDAELKKLRDGFAQEDLERARDAQNMIEDNRLALMKEGQDREIEELQEKYNRERIAIQENEKLKEGEKLELLKQLKELEGQELKAISEKYAEEEKQLKIDKFNEYAETVKGGISAISDLNEAVSNIAIQRAEGDQKKQEQIARRAFNINKALQLGIATVTGIQAVQNAYTGALLSPITKVNPAYPFIQAGIAAATSAANIAKIASARFQGGGSVSAPSGGASQGASAATFSIGANTSTEQTQLNADGTQANGGGTVKVFVAESDITETQDNVKQINTLSTF